MNPDPSQPSQIRDLAERTWNLTYPDRRPWSEISPDAQEEWVRVFTNYEANRQGEKRDYFWIYVVDPQGRVVHDRSMPLDCKTRASQRVAELIDRGLSAFFSESFIKEAYY